MVSADTYHVRHAYAAFPNARSFPIFVVGLVWAGLFCLPPAIMLQALTANAKAHWGYDLLKGVCDHRGGDWLSQLSAGLDVVAGVSN